MTQALKQLNALKAQPAPVTLLDTVRLELAIAGAGYAYRNAARQEELRVYELASYASVELSVLPLVPVAMRAPLKAAIAGLHSLYILAGIDQYYLVNVHFTHPYADAKPVDMLRSFYQEAFEKYKVQPSYLASSKFIKKRQRPAIGGGQARSLLPRAELWRGGATPTSAHRSWRRAPGPLRRRRRALTTTRNLTSTTSTRAVFALAYPGRPVWLDHVLEHHRLRIALPPVKIRVSTMEYRSNSWRALGSPSTRSVSTRGQGLLTPRRDGRVTWYGDSHLSACAHPELQQRACPDCIQRSSPGSRSVGRALAAVTHPSRGFYAAELAERGRRAPLASLSRQAFRFPSNRETSPCTRRRISRRSPPACSSSPRACRWGL